MIANAQSKIQIVDTHESPETLVKIDIAVGDYQINRTLHTPNYKLILVTLADFI